MREGYKKTEVGIIPEDWEVKSKFINIFSGNGFKLNEYVEDGIPLIRINNVTHGKLLDNDWKYLPHEYRDTYNSYLIKRGDILLALNRPITRGKLKICSVDIDEAILYQRVGKLSMDESKFSSKYYYYMQSSLFMKKLEAGLVGTDQPYIKNSEFKEIEFIVPSLKEQEKIAEILSTVDSQIDDTEKLIEKSKELKKGLMQKLLTKGIGHSEFKKTEVGEIPSSWEVKRLEEVCNIKGGKRLPKGCQLLDEKTKNPYIRVADMYEGGVNLKNIKYVPFEAADKIKNYRISKDDLFISVAGTLGIVGKVPTELDGANLTENADKLCDIKINKEFLMRVLQSTPIQNIIEAEKTSNAQPKLALNRIREFIISVPSKEEQEKIAQILSSVDNEIEEYENKKQKLEELKKGLMQQLLTGKIRTI